MIDYDKLKEVIDANKRIQEIAMDLMPAHYKTEGLAQPEPKSIVWAVAGGKPTEYIYTDAIKDFKLYPTKAALIESQIEYWLSQKEPTATCCATHAGGYEECKEVCSHEFKNNTCTKCHLNYWLYSDESVAGTFATCCKKCNEPWSCCDCKEELETPRFEGEIKGFNQKPQSQCKHESDGHFYPLRGAGKERKCIKCGEFYK